jgi:hypothetical protein
VSGELRFTKDSAGRDLLEPIDFKGNVLIGNHGNLDAADHIESLRTNSILIFLFNQQRETRADCFGNIAKSGNSLLRSFPHQRAFPPQRQRSPSRRARYKRLLDGLVRPLLRLSSDIYTIADVSLVFLIKVNFSLFRGYNFACFFTVPVPVQEALKSGLHGLVILV